MIRLICQTIGGVFDHSCYESRIMCAVVMLFVFAIKFRWPCRNDVKRDKVLDICDDLF